MSSREVGIEQARKTLGDLANEVRYSGNDIVLTRNGKPVARLAPLKENPMSANATRALAEATTIMRNAGLPMADRDAEHPLGYKLKVMEDTIHLTWWNGPTQDVKETEERQRIAFLLFRKQKWGSLPAPWGLMCLVPPWSEYMALVR